MKTLLIRPTLLITALLLMTAQVFMTTRAQEDVTITLESLLQTGPIPEEGETAYKGAHLGVIVLDATTGDVLFNHNEDDAFTPASSLKLLTTAALLDKLGIGYQFTTQVLGGAVEEGYVPYLVLRGVGDPTLKPTGEHSLETLAQQLFEAGIREVDDLYVDDFAFDFLRWGSGWMWDDPAFPIGAIFLDGLASPYGEMVSEGTPNPDLITNADTYALEIGRLFRVALGSAGITVNETIFRQVAMSEDQVLASITSAPLIDIVQMANKESVNEYVEQMYARLGLADETVGSAPSTPDSSYEALASFLTKVGINPDETRLRDASGLSRYNLISPNQLATLLRYMYLNPVMRVKIAPNPELAYKENFNLFIESLPLAGTGENTPEAAARGGTLANRLVDSGLDVRAKTGSMTGVSSLSGYMTTDSGRILVFVMLMDNYVGLGGDLRRLQDALLGAMRTF
jgi:serine-type D-Ala-D-Ala carboxypeptidase/endopeptidase (penicillin-binding protein 4)